MQSELMVENLRQTLNIHDHIIMYAGNLEHYQGLDLLLESVSLLKHSRNLDLSLVVIGGDDDSILKYRKVISTLGISEIVFLIGPKPVEHLSSYLSQADILVSPRLKGVNTPMKLFSYLASGKPTLVTNLPTHTQVVDSCSAFIANPNPKDFSEGLYTLLSDKQLCRQIGIEAQKLVRENHSRTSFGKRFAKIMDWLEYELEALNKA